MVYAHSKTLVLFVSCFPHRYHGLIHRIVQLVEIHDKSLSGLVLHIYFYSRVICV